MRSFAVSVATSMKVMKCACRAAAFDLKTLLQGRLQHTAQFSSRALSGSCTSRLHRIRCSERGLNHWSFHAGTSLHALAHSWQVGLVLTLAALTLSLNYAWLTAANLPFRVKEMRCQVRPPPSPEYLVLYHRRTARSDQDLPRITPQGRLDCGAQRACL